MEWYQIVAIVLMTIKVTGGLFKHGETVKISFFSNILWTVVWIFILYYGGFW